VIARVAAFAQARIGYTLEVGARHVIEQQVVVEIEQLSEALHQVGFDCLLVRQQSIQAAVEPLVVDCFNAYPEEILQRRGAVPALCHVQFAGWFAQSTNHQNRNDIGPLHRFTSTRQQGREQFIELQRLPQLQSQPYRPNASRAFQAHRIEANLDRFSRYLRVEQRALRIFAPSPCHLPGQQPRAGSTLGVQLAQLRHRLLHYLAPATNRTNQAPVHVGLAVFASRARA